ncbi:hypothetical protein Tco_0135248 [Tanacetum coccineum]
MAWFLGFDEVLSCLLVEGNLEEATAVRKAIVLLRQVIGSSPRKNIITAKPKSTRDEMNSAEWDELIHIEMVETVVEAEDCFHAEDRLHLHRVHVVQDKHEANQGTDKAKIIRKLSKLDKHGHGNGRARKKLGKNQFLVNSWST